METTVIETSAAQIASKIRESILGGELKPGHRLREAELSAAFHISRSPIREALRMLEGEGLVQISPNKGASVTQFNEKDLKEIYELRTLLEQYAIRIASRHMTDAHLQDLQNIFQEMEEIFTRQDDLGYLKSSHGFHEYYINHCGNERLCNLFKILSNNILAIQRLALARSERTADSLQEHKKILNALCRRDPEKAAGCVDRHLKSVYERAKEFLGNKPMGA